MTKKSAIQFAQWLQATHPDIFVSILHHAQPVNKLGDWSDVLSSVGDAASSAVSAVGNFVSNPANVNALSSVATAYFKSQTPSPVLANQQGMILNTQLQRAQAGLSPAPVGYQTNAFGQQVPVYAQGGSTYPLSASNLASMQPSFLQKYGMILAIGGGVVLLLVIIAR